MSDLGNFLANQLDLQDITSNDMSSRMGLSRAHFSAFLTGKKTGCNVETLMKMARGIGPEPVDPHVQAGLLTAYFRDQCLELYKAWIHVTPSLYTGAETARVRQESPDDSTPSVPDGISEITDLLRVLRLPIEVVRALADIAAGIPDHDKFRIVIQDLGKFAREELSPSPTPKLTDDPPTSAHGAMIHPPQTVPEPAKVKYQATPKTATTKAAPHPKSTAGIHAMARKTNRGSRGNTDF